MPTVAELQQGARAKINWDQVLNIASSIRGQPCAVFEGEQLSGGCNIINRIVFDDGILWALRVSYSELRLPVEDTVTTMRYVQRTVPSIPVAAVHAWSDSEDGDGVGTPYMLLDWVDGKVLEWNANVPPPAAREKILGQLAQYTVDLLERTAVHSSPQSALTWILRRIDVRLARILTGELPTFDPVDCLIYRAMAKDIYFVSPLDAFPFPLMHTDLGRLNILVNDSFDITGILDWDDCWVCRLPLQCAAMCPAMIAAVNDPQHGELFRKDRVAFTRHFASAIHSSCVSDDILVHLSSIMADDELQVFQSSIKSKGAYAHWVTKYAVQSARWVRAATEALDEFVLVRPDMASSSGVLSVHACLLEMQDDGLGLEMYTQ